MNAKFLLRLSLLALVLTVASTTAAWCDPPGTKDQQDKDKPGADKKILLKVDGEVTAQDPLTQVPQDSGTREAPSRVHAVKLAAGKLYKIDLLGVGGLTPYLRVQDGTGKVLARNAFGDGDNARLFFPATRTETYQLIATTADGVKTGKYTLIVALADPDADAASSLRLQGRLWYEDGDYAAARSFLEQALAVGKKVGGDDSIQVGETLKDLGNVLSRQGDYAGARPLLERALTIYKKDAGDGVPSAGVADRLLDLGDLLYFQGDYAAARSSYEQGLDAINKLRGGQKDYYAAKAMTSLGLVLAQLGDYAAAQSHLQQALKIRKAILRPTSPTLAQSLNNLGALLCLQGDYAAALPYYEQALALCKQALGDGHPLTAACLHNLADLLYQKGDDVAARPYFDKALAIRRKVLGDNHPDTAASLSSQGNLLSQQGDYAAARAKLEEALKISRLNVQRSAAGQSERQQLLMVQMLRQPLDSLLSIPSRGAGTAATDYAHVLSWKGSTLARQQRMRLARLDPKLAPLLQEMQLTTERLATQSASTPDDPKKQSAWSKQLHELSEQQEKLERDLAASSEPFRQDQAQTNLTPADLLKALPADTALVDFLVYRHAQPDPKQKGKWLAEQRLTAFVLRPGAAIVRLELGPMEPIEKAIESWRSNSKEQPDPEHPGVELRRRLWLPLEKHLAGARITLIGPDGALGRLPFAALPGSKEGSYLLEEVALSVVPVPRLLPELLRRDNADEKGSPPSLLLVGEVNFDSSPGASDTGPRAVAPTRTGQLHNWSFLKGTKAEIAAIRTSFETTYPKGQVTVLREDEPTDTAVVAQVGKHRFLHLATHGFFAAAEVRSALTGEERSAAGSTAFGTPGVSGFHPGLLSGLVLAGANKPVPGSDGILTALEVANLDFGKVELVVLSACETGLGKVAGGEGVLGLQRSFQIAGARSVVASLWTVPDEQTSKLMVRFYGNLWDRTRPMSKLEALREAQLYMLREGAGGEKRAAPYYWAAFVLSGDWR